MNPPFALTPPVNLQDDLRNTELWHEGRLILFNKALEWTSFDLVGKTKISLRDGLGIKKIKLGHAGTLDPKATGLMILLTGKYTKMADYIHTFDKTYEAVFYLGATTPCFDTERPVDMTYPVDHITDASIHQAAAAFVGKITQLPPIFSAVKIDGKTAYKSAHKGKDVVTRPREVTVHDFIIRKIQMPLVQVTIRCSTGTYIRSIANDLGKALGSGSYLAALQRTAIGPYTLDQAVAIEDFAAKMRSYKANEALVE
jgi:tRNA pseudouridine55 synthase